MKQHNMVAALCAGLAIAAFAGPARPEDNTLRVGVLASLSGPFAQLGEDSRDGVELAFQEVGNQIAGRPVKLFIEDSAADPAKAVEKIAEVGQVDLVIVAVKLWDTEEIAPTLRPLAERGAVITSFQNGVQKDELLRKYVPSDAVMGGVCYIAAAIAEPGVIRHTGTIQRLIFGEYVGGEARQAGGG